MRLLHSGHTSKLSFILHTCFTDNGPTQEFFHCFSIVSRMLYAIMVPHRSLNFTWHHFTLSLFFPPFSLRFPIFFPFFYVKVLPFFHCFSHLMSYFLIFFIVFLINLPRSTSEVSRMLYAIMVPHRSLNFTWHHFTLSLFFPPFSLLSHLFSILLCPVLPLCALFFSSYVIFPYFSIVFLINLPRSTSEGGPGGNRYPNVTQLPP